MKKYLKLVLPLLMISSLALISVANATTNQPVMSWGVKSGDVNEFTAGWELNLNLPDFIWTNLSTAFDSAYGTNISLKQAYSDFTTLPSVFNIKTTITSISNTGDTYSPEDKILADIQLKTPSQSTSEYKEAPLFLQGLLSQYNSTISKYSGLLDTMTGTQNFLSMLSNELTAMSSSSSSLPIAYWWTPSQYDNSSSPGTFSLFVPKTFDFTSYYNITQINTELNKTYEDYSSGITYNNYWSYAQAVYGLPSNVNSFNSMLSALGVTTFNVNTKSISANFDFSKINQNVLNSLVNSTLTQGYPYMLSELGLSGSVTFDQYLQAVGKQLGWTITTPTITAATGITYDSNGILQNAHVQFSFSTKINGQTLSFSPVFDVSNGVHSSINANWHGSTVPGYPIWLIGLASLGGMTIVVVSMKKKKR